MNCKQILKDHWDVGAAVACAYFISDRENLPEHIRAYAAFAAGLASLYGANGSPVRLLRNMCAGLTTICSTVDAGTEIYQKMGAMALTSAVALGADREFKNYRKRFSKEMRSFYGLG